MIELIFSRSPLVHLAIDIQDVGLQDLAAEERKTSFPAAVRQFADELRTLGIPTIWVVYTKEFAFQPHTPARPQWLKETGLAVPVHDNELVYAKGRQNAFFDPQLEIFLKKVGTSDIIFTGMCTMRCVLESVINATRTFDAHVVYDLLAEDKVGMDAGSDRNPQQHRKQFGEGWIPSPLTNNFLQKRHLHTRKEILDLARQGMLIGHKKPAPPMWTTPVLNSQSTAKL